MSFAVFSDNNKLLPCICKPYAQEILSSWLTRLAFYHGLNTLEFCCLVLMQHKHKSFDIDRLITNEKINRLAERTQCSVSEIEATTLQYYLGRLFTVENLANATEPWLLPNVQVLDRKEHRYYHRSGLMFCPLCLKKKVYFKREWRLAISLICLDCECYLLDRCPHCKTGNSFMSVEGHNFLKGSLDHYLIACHHCHEDVTDCKIEMASQNMLDLQRKLNHFIDHDTDNPLVSKRSYLKALSFFCRLLLNPFRKGRGLVPLVQDVYQLNDLHFDRYAKIYTEDLRYISIRKRADVVQMADWLLCQWPQRFLNLCRNNGVHRSDLLKLIDYQPGWFKEAIYYGLMPDKWRHPYSTKITSLKKEITAKPKKQPTKTRDYEMDEPHNDATDYTPRSVLYYGKWWMGH